MTVVPVATVGAITIPTAGTVGTAQWPRNVHAITVGTAAGGMAC
ncbi:hypothetical protein [Streptomyces sp. NPDC002845]